MTPPRLATNPYGCDSLCRAPGQAVCPRCEPNHWAARSATCDRLPHLPVVDTALAGIAGITHAHGTGPGLLDCDGHPAKNIKEAWAD